MNHLDVALAARAFAARRGVPSATVRHRRLAPAPLAVVAWHLGGEQFSVAALGWGDDPARPRMAVPGEPRNRDLLFAALRPFADWFNARFEAPAADRETLTRGEYRFSVARTAPQVVVPNRATAELLGRLGRRLAHLPTDGPRAADPALVRLGRHLRFLWDRCGFPGQQLLVPFADVVNAHWATPQSGVERQSLAALDAFIDPPGGADGFAAAEEAERRPAGPSPEGDDDDRLMPLVERFNAARNRRTDPAVVAPLRTPIEEHYRPLLRRAWDLLWRCRDRELGRPEAGSVGRRWDADRQEYTRHIDWLARNGLRRTRQTPRQAATTLRAIEEAGRLLEAEEACDDPLRMAAVVLANKAVRGRVVAVDPDHKEPGPRRAVRRPLVTLRSPDPCLTPPGRELWWTRHPDGAGYAVEAVSPGPGGGSDVVLKLTTSAAAPLPAVGEDACFSAHTTRPRWLGQLPDADPWTHVSAAPAAPPVPLDDALTPEV